MSNPTNLDVGPLEMEVLGTLSSGPEHTVGEVQTMLKKSGNSLAYTTVMTVLTRLYNKGLVHRRKESRYFIYSVAEKKEASTLKIFEKVKNSLFGDERLKPILSLLDGEEKLSKSELEQLKRVVDGRLQRMKK